MGEISLKTSVAATLAVIGLIVLIAGVNRTGGDTIDLSVNRGEISTGPTSSASSPPPQPEQAQPQPQKPSGSQVWARGSWLRVVGLPEGCVVAPVVESLGILCTTSSALCGSPAKLRVESQSGITVVGAKCAGGGCSGELPTPEGSAGQWTFEHPAMSCLQDQKTASYFDFAVKFDNPDVPPEVCFASIGDWGKAHADMIKVANVMAEVSRKRFAKFIISTGDNFYPTGVKSLKDPQWEKTFEKPYSDPALKGVRWYICAGNHDQWGLSPQLAYGKTHPRWYFPSLSYAETIPLTPGQNLGMVTLDTYGRNVRQQMTMLREKLKAYQEDASVTLSLVLNHAPLYSGAYHGQEPRTVQLRNQLKPIMDENGAHAYFNGDDHTLEVLKSASVDYFVNGAGGGSAIYGSKKLPETVFHMPKGVRGFMLHCWDAASRTMSTELIDMEGKVIYTHKTAGKK